MSDQTDLFTKEAEKVEATIAPTEPATTETKVEEPSTKSYNDYLSRIKNEEGMQKYANVEDALTGAAHAQEFISTLKSEKTDLVDQISTLKAELEKRMSVENAMEQLASRKEEPQTSAVSGLTREDVQAILKAEEQQKIHQANRAKVSEALIKFYGQQEKAQEAIKSKSMELGLSVEDFAQLVNKSPASAMKLLGLEETKKSIPSSEGSLNSEALAQQSSNQPKPKKNVMVMANDGDLLEEWRASREEALAKIESQQQHF